MKTEVYSWRVSPDIKTGLERVARRRNISLSAALDLAARDWLDKNRGELQDEEGQERLHRAAEKWLGSLAGGDAHRSENASRTVRQHLRRRYGR